MTPTADAKPSRHYPTAAAKCADLVVHIVGLSLAVAGGGVLLGLAVAQHSLSKVAAVAIYAAGLLAMLAFSTAYNFARAADRPVLRRLDHAGIFLMIAGSYTPFTTHSLSGGWAWGMTAAVWTLAALGRWAGCCCRTWSGGSGSASTWRWAGWGWWRSGRCWIVSPRLCCCCWRSAA